MTRAVKIPHQASRRSQRSARPATTSGPAPVSPASVHCACGGGCPRCRVQPKPKVPSPRDEHEIQADQGHSLLLARHLSDPGSGHDGPSAQRLDRRREGGGGAAPEEAV